MQQAQASGASAGPDGKAADEAKPGSSSDDVVDADFTSKDGHKA